MRWRFWRRSQPNGEAKRARAEAERRLREARREWPAVRQTHDQLAEWMDQALRGRGA